MKGRVIFRRRGTVLSPERRRIGSGKDSRGALLKPKVAL